MNSKVEYSIWFVPTGETETLLQKVISDLSCIYQTSSFKPHVTLLGGMTGQEAEIIAKAKQLASELKPFEIKLNKVACFDTYFRSLVILAEKTEEIMEANRKARGAFVIEQKEEYMPHLSLMYNSLNQETKEQIIKKIGNEFRLSFIADSIHVYPTSDPVEKWRLIEKFPLVVK